MFYTRHIFSMIIPPLPVSLRVGSNLMQLCFPEPDTKLNYIKTASIFSLMSV